MKNKYFLTIVLFSLMLNCSCLPHKSRASQFTPELNDSSIVNITGVWDLNGDTILLPADVTLNFKRGVITNGVLVGDRSKISGNKKAIFDNVKIEGSWNIPQISTNFFYDLKEENALRNVIALTDTMVQNTVSIEEGNYYFNLKNEQDLGILIKSNTTIIVKGEIFLRANALQSCSIIKISGENIHLMGKGAIIGDKGRHKGKMGEWGMGIYVKGGKNVTISDLTIKDCWGDCIYIGGKSSSVTIDKCNLINGRRQGLSVTSASNITIRNSEIRNVYGTDPQYGIDIEPNKGGVVENVCIDRVVIDNCYGGILCWGVESEYVKDIFIKNCKISHTKSIYPIQLVHVSNITISNCMVKTNKENCVLAKRVSNFNSISNNFQCNGKNSVKQTNK